MVSSLSSARPMPASLCTVKILMVEDSQGDVYLMKRLLEEASVDCPYEIMDVPRLVDAFHQLEKETFDLVLLDLNLLDIDGLSSVAALHAQAPDLTIVVYSGMDDPKIKENALICGATDYLVKGSENGQNIKNIIERIAHKNG